MDLIPHDEIHRTQHVSFAPMIDFLFLMLSLFATLAISKATLFDSEITLAQLKKEQGKSPIKTQSQMQQIHLSIGPTGAYKWLSKFQDYPMENVQAIQEELSRQFEHGILAQDKRKTEILLHIDKTAPWEAVANAIFGVRELGFQAYPVYEELDRKTSQLVN